MEEVKSGVLKGVEIAKEKAAEVAEVVGVEKAMDELHKVVPGSTPVESAIASLMGAEGHGDKGSAEVVGAGKAEDGGVLKGVAITGEQNEEMGVVASTVEAVKKAADGKAADLGETLGVAMGVVSEKK